MYVGEGKTLPDIPTKYCRIAATLTFASERETEIIGLMCHFISFWLLPTKRGEEEKKIERGQSNYIYHYVPSRLISEV